ncbi:MAG: ThiF family adenylyltransferase [Bacilli bacterium]
MIFQRLKYLFGLENLEKLNNAKVAVIGLGGVGGITAISLARSGVGNIIICDYDVVDITNINRQIIANIKNIGRLKTDVLEEMILEINPNCKVTKISQKVNDSLFLENPNFIIDCIDDIKSKKYLIEQCLTRKIKFISSMGAAKKVDPSKIAVVKLSKTSYDPIAKILRNHFKNNDFYVVSSTEKPAKIDVLGSYMNVVSTFGLFLSDYIIKCIIRR